MPEVSAGCANAQPPGGNKNANVPIPGLTTWAGAQGIRAGGGGVGHCWKGLIHYISETKPELNPVHQPHSSSFIWSKGSLLTLKILFFRLLIGGDSVVFRYDFATALRCLPVVWSHTSASKHFYFFYTNLLAHRSAIIRLIHLPSACRGRTGVRFPAISSHMCF